MPELPDVEVLKGRLERTSLGRRISRVEVRDGRVVGEVSARGLREALEGRSLRRVHRHGKNLFAGVEGGGWVLMHFGMAGGLSHLPGTEEEPPHVRLLLGFDGGDRLAFTDRRALGRVHPIRDPESFVREKGLGPDAFRVDYPSFRERLGGRRGAVKSVLMNQGVVAGLGNIYSDEVLFRARLHPRTGADRLGEEDIRRLFEATGGVLQTAIDRGADPEALPGSFLLPRRREGARCPRGNGEIRRLRIAGRTAYYCPACQPGRRES